MYRLRTMAGIAGNLLRKGAWPCCIRGGCLVALEFGSPIRSAACWETGGWLVCALAVPKSTPVLPAKVPFTSSAASYRPSHTVPLKRFLCLLYSQVTRL